ISETAPIAFPLYGLVGDGTLDHEHERIELAPLRLVEPFDERVRSRFSHAARTALEIDERPMDCDLRQSRQGAQRNLFDTRLHSGGKRHRIPIATQAGVYPQHVNYSLIGCRSGHVHEPPFCVSDWLSVVDF